MNSRHLLTDAQLRLPLRVNPRHNAPAAVPTPLEGQYRVIKPFVGALSWAEHSQGKRFPRIPLGTILTVCKPSKGSGYCVFEGNSFVALLSGAQVESHLERIEEMSCAGVERGTERPPHLSGGS